MTSDELNEEYMNMCGEQDDCDNCKYGKFHCQLSFGYSKGRADKYQEIISECMLLTEEQVADIRTDAIDECMRAIVNTESKVVNPCASKTWDELTLLANRQFEILEILEQLKEQNK